VSVENEFEPRLGRLRNRGGKGGRRYLQRVLAATNLARGCAAGRQVRAGFTGSRVGRGAGVGRLLATRGSGSALTRRRVVIKAQIVKLAGRGASAAAAHLRYLQRDGTTREGERGALYGANSEAIEAKEFHARGAGDRHQFRFIVSPEDGAQYDDLKPLVRRLMSRAEADLGTKLDWVAVDHFNTGHPHSHVLVRGVDEKGRDLVIARDYLTGGFRERAAELIELDLGPRSDRDIARGLLAEVDQERLTSIDRKLIAIGGEERVVEASAPGAFDQTLRAGRLAKLSRLGLAEAMGEGRWRLAPDLAETLTRMGERGDIIRTMQREFARRGASPTWADQMIYDPAATGAAPLVGRVLGRGLADEHRDRHFLIVDGVDGRSHYVAIGNEPAEGVGEGAVVRVEPIRAAVRDADRTLAAVAVGNDGRYDVDAHLRQDPSASQAFAEAHVRRLEAVRRLNGSVERRPDGSWIIGADYLERAAEHENALVKARPVQVTTLAFQPLRELAGADAATWLDRELTADGPENIRDAGFGKELRDALARRRLWLFEQGLAGGDGGQAKYGPDLLATLRRRELLRVSAQLSHELGLSFADAASGRFAGTYRRPVEMVSGRHALIQTDREFTLVPWRPVLDRQAGKFVSGIVRGDKVSWTVGRTKSGPSVA
jgi:type IV secretory pathway VirD2 relaxase